MTDLPILYASAWTSWISQVTNPSLMIVPIKGRLWLWPFVTSKKLHSQNVGKNFIKWPQSWCLNPLFSAATVAWLGLTLWPVNAFLESKTIHLEQISGNQQSPDCQEKCRNGIAGEAVFNDNQFHNFYSLIGCLESCNPLQGASNKLH